MKDVEGPRKRAVKHSYVYWNKHRSRRVVRKKGVSFGSFLTYTEPSLVRIAWAVLFTNLDSLTRFTRGGELSGGVEITQVFKGWGVRRPNAWREIAGGKIAQRPAPSSRTPQEALEKAVEISEKDTTSLLRRQGRWCCSRRGPWPQPTTEGELPKRIESWPLLGEFGGWAEVSQGRFRLG